MDFQTFAQILAQMKGATPPNPLAGFAPQPPAFAQRPDPMGPAALAATPTLGQLVDRAGAYEGPLQKFVGSGTMPGIGDLFPNVDLSGLYLKTNPLAWLTGHAQRAVAPPPVPQGQGSAVLRNLAGMGGAAAAAPRGPQTMVIGAGGVQEKPDTATGTGFERWLIGRESGGNPQVVNKYGYAGLYQFGEPRLSELGVYTPTEEGRWAGQFDIPGMPEIRTIKDFLGSREAQQKAFKLHVSNIDQKVQKEGLDRYVGQTIAGVPITHDGLLAMAHLGGFNGAKKFLQTGGEYNPADANGTRLSDYARGAATAGAGGGFPSVPQSVAPQLPGAPQLQTPSGVQTAGLMDAYNQAAPQMRAPGPTDRLMNVIAGLSGGAANAGRGGGLTAADVLAALGGGAAAGAAGDTARQQERGDRLAAATAEHQRGRVGLMQTIAGLEAANRNLPIQTANQQAELNYRRGAEQAKLDAEAQNVNTQARSQYDMARFKTFLPEATVADNQLVVKQLQPDGSMKLTTQDFGTMNRQLKMMKQLKNIDPSNPQIDALKWSALREQGPAAVVYGAIDELVSRGAVRNILSEDGWKAFMEDVSKGLTPGQMADPKDMDEAEKQQMRNKLTQEVSKNPALLEKIFLALRSQGVPIPQELFKE